MTRHKVLRRVLTLMAAATAALALTTTAVVVNAAPAAAASIGVPFAFGQVNGTITFDSNGHSYRVDASIYNDRPSGSVAYRANGQYFEGNARITCVTGPYRSNSSRDTIRGFSDPHNCSIANIHVVQIHKYFAGSWVAVISINNPYTN